MNSTVRKYVSRYVVPFYFDYEDNGYETIRQHFLSNTIDNQALGLPKDGEWINVGFWENYKSVKNAQAEMDIYSYLPLVFLEGKKSNENAVSNFGISFVYKSRGKLLGLEYKHNEEKPIAFDCKDLGILLFRNGIGFVWYETEFRGKVSVDEYVGFQHDFKELSRTHNEKFVKKSFDEEKNVVTYKPFCLGEWLSRVIAADTLRIRFWAERETKSGEDSNVRIPDKALLFQYMFVERTANDDRDNLVFRIANGYDEKYNAPDDIAANLYKPFGNVCFYISKAGMACVVTNADSNEAFFDGQFRGKYIRDYFFIYVLLLYQSYSCAHYSRLLIKLPAEEKEFDKQEAYSKLESLNGQINLFFVKSVFESVSNIDHQNGAYRYGKQALCIEGDIQSLAIGLSALEEMEKDKRDQKINLAMTVFGLMVVISTWIDGLNLVDWLVQNVQKDRNMNPGHIGISAGIIVLTLYLIFTLLRNRRKK